MTTEHSSKKTYDQLMNSVRGIQTVPSPPTDHIKTSPVSPQIDLSLTKDVTPVVNTTISLPDHDTSCFKIPKRVVWILAIVIGVVICIAFLLWMRRKAKPAFLQLPSTSHVNKEDQAVETASEDEDDIDMDSIDVMEEVEPEHCAADAYEENAHEEDEYFTPL